MAITTTIDRRPRGLVRLDATIIVDASGNASLLLPALYGKVVEVLYDAGTLATGVDITLADSVTGMPVLVLTNAGTADRLVRPSVNVSLQDGANIAASTSATDVYKDLYVYGKLQMTVAQGGNLATGKVTLIVNEAATS